MREAEEQVALYIYAFSSSCWFCTVQTLAQPGVRPHFRRARRFSWLPFRRGQEPASFCLSILS